MTRIGIVVASMRPSRGCAEVAAWVASQLPFGGRRLKVLA